MTENKHSILTVPALISNSNSQRSTRSTNANLSHHTSQQSTNSTMPQFFPSVKSLNVMSQFRQTRYIFTISEPDDDTIHRLHAFRQSFCKYSIYNNLSTTDVFDPFNTFKLEANIVALLRSGGDYGGYLQGVLLLYANWK